MGLENAKAVAFLSWIDCLERFDVLIEELRNIQHNIAFQLKSEPLYLISLYEESFLDANYELYTNFYEYNKRHRKHLSFAIMPDFPAPRQLKGMSMSSTLLGSGESSTHLRNLTNHCLHLLNQLNSHNVRTEKWKDSNQAELLSRTLGGDDLIWPRVIDREVRRCLGREKIESFIEKGLEEDKIDLVFLSGVMTLGLFQFWQATFWSLDQRQLYYNLRATQALKRSIFNDKMFLLYKGAQAFIQKSPDHEEKMYEVLTIRRALLVKCQGYIQKLSAHQSCVAENYEHGEQGLTRPLINRRRDQALYSRVLNDLCANTFQEMGSLLKDCKEKIDFEHRDVSLIHHWGYQYTSEYSSLYRPHSIVTHSYFKTSFWMPDRPDLQSAIIHEVGHVFTDETFKRFEQSYFSSNNLPFASLFIRLRNILNAYEVEVRGGLPLKSVLQEIGVDILASSVKGPSYLYVLAIEILGEAIETMYGTTIDSLFEKQLDPSEAFIYDLENAAFQWHFRLHIVCTWIELLNDDFPQKRNPSRGLTDRLIDGVRNLADGLLHQVQTWIERNVGGLREEHKLWNYHKDLKEALCRTITTSRLSIHVRQHLIKKEKTRTCDTVRTKPLHLFSPKAQEFLFNGLLSHKFKFKENCNEEFNSIDEVIAFFSKQYGVKIEIDNELSRNGYIKYNHIDIFNHLHDIPWQCAMMKGIDFAKLTTPNNNEINNSPLAYSLMRPALGRGVYQAAVDLFYHNVENPLYHLEECTSQFSALRKNLEDSQMMLMSSSLNESIDIRSNAKFKKMLGKELSRFVANECSNIFENEDVLKTITDNLRNYYENPEKVDLQRYDLDQDIIFSEQQSVLQITRVILQIFMKTLNRSLDVHLFRIKTELQFFSSQQPANWKERCCLIITDLINKMFTSHKEHVFFELLSNEILVLTNNNYDDIKTGLDRSTTDKELNDIFKLVETNFTNLSEDIYLKNIGKIIGHIEIFIHEKWPIDISQMHSFLSCLNNADESGEDLLCKAMSQPLCAELASKLNLDKDKLPGGASIWSLNKVTTAHLHKINLDIPPTPMANHSLMNLTPVLGKYDFMSITHETVPLPVRINSLNIFTKRAFPFFMRKETVIPVFLKNIHPNHHEDRPERIETLALICVRMNRSTWRLHFLLRMLKSFKYLMANESLYTIDWDTVPCDLEIASCLRSTDRVYLSDGSNDLFFEIRGDSTTRINDVFKLKDLLFDDYQTSLVETLPGEALLKQASADPNFKLVLCLQIRQSRDLSRSLQSIKNNLKSAFTDHISELTALHGKMDIRIVLKNTENFQKIDGLTSKLNDICRKKINKMQLAIEEIIPLQ